MSRIIKISILSVLLFIFILIGLYFYTTTFTQNTKISVNTNVNQQSNKIQNNSHLVAKDEKQVENIDVSYPKAKKLYEYKTLLLTNFKSNCAQLDRNDQKNCVVNILGGERQFNEYIELSNEAAQNAIQLIPGKKETLVNVNTNKEEIREYYGFLKTTSENKLGFDLINYIEDISPANIEVWGERYVDTLEGTRQCVLDEKCISYLDYWISSLPSGVYIKNEKTEIVYFTSVNINNVYLLRNTDQQSEGEEGILTTISQIQPTNKVIYRITTDNNNSILTLVELPLPKGL